MNEADMYQDMQGKELRKVNAKADKDSGRRAYSDAFNHVIVKIGNTEHGFDLACAIQLKTDLDKAISYAALHDAEFGYKC